MAHELPPKVKSGTLGELLAQLHLLALGVQAAPPIRDSGNDLIAGYKEKFFALQVKTKKAYSFSKKNLPRIYDGAVLIVLTKENERYKIESATVYLLSRAEIESAVSLGKKGLGKYKICLQRVNEVFTATNAR